MKYEYGDVISNSDDDRIPPYSEIWILTDTITNYDRPVYSLQMYIHNKFDQDYPVICTSFRKRPE